MRNYKKWFENYTFFYGILDEGHKIKNPKAKATIALKHLDIKHRLILTGTPIQNTIEELWCLMDFIQPGILSSLRVFKEEYCSLILKASKMNASNLDIAMAKDCTHRLRVLIRPHILRRTKSMLTKTCKLLPKNEYIVFCQPSTSQILITMKLRNQLVHRTNSSRSFKDTLFKEDLGLISKARKICNHPFLLFWDETENKLSSDLVNKESEETIETRDQLIDLIYEQREKSGKLKILEKLLKEWRNEEGKRNKVLVFSQTKVILDVVQKMLDGLEGGQRA